MANWQGTHIHVERPVGEGAVAVPERVILELNAQGRYIISTPVGIDLGDAFVVSAPIASAPGRVVLSTDQVNERPPFRIGPTRILD